MKYTFPAIFVWLLSGCLNGNEHLETGIIESPVVPDSNSPAKTDFKPWAFQPPALQGTMPAAGESLEEVEKNALRGCGGGLDCIPAYSYPDILSASQAGNLQDNDLVLGAYINGKARAYPLSTLWQHEIANDTLGGVGLSINYCPLTGTGLNFKGSLKDGTPVTFGVSGLLRNNNLILYDRQTFSYWPQMLFTAAWGERRGEQIQLLPIMEITWKAWKRLFPQTTVVSGNLGGAYPYGDYYTNNDYILFSQFVDARLRPKDLVIGVIGKQSVKVYPFKNMKSVDVINDIMDDVPIVILFSRQAQSAQVYERTVSEGIIASFNLANPGNTLLPEIASPDVPGKWNFAGVELTGTSLIKNLDPVVTSFKGFWLSWGTYYNVTEIYGEPENGN